MSRARKSRRAARWARYANHYSAHASVYTGGLAESSATELVCWWFIRGQAKHRFEVSS